MGVDRRDWGDGFTSLYPKYKGGRPSKFTSALLQQEGDRASQLCR